jgi:hypothetical protein
MVPNSAKVATITGGFVHTELVLGDDAFLLRFMAL